MTDKETLIKMFDIAKVDYYRNGNAIEINGQYTSDGIIITTFEFNSDESLFCVEADEY